MARREVSFEADPISTVLSGTDINPEAHKGLEMVVSHTIDSRGLEWVDKAGFIGLDRDVTENLKEAVPEGCTRFDEGCRAEIEFDSGDAGREGSIEITCPRPYLGDAKTKAEANEQEAQQSEACKACHLQMSERILGWLSGVPVAAERAEQHLGIAEAGVVMAKNARNNVFELDAQPSK